MNDNGNRPRQPTAITHLQTALWSTGSGLAVISLAYVLGRSVTPEPAAVAILLAAYGLMLAANTTIITWLISRLPPPQRRKPHPLSGPHTAVLAAGNALFLLVMAVTADLNLSHGILLIAPGCLLHLANNAIFRWLISPPRHSPEDTTK